MSKETEYKFLVKDDSYKRMATASHEISQGYISRRPEGTVRVRVLDREGFLTVKGANRGATRDEWEYPIPIEDARDMLSRVCQEGVIEKTRWIVPYGGLTWEVDEFHGRHAGLVVAEVELPSPDTPLPAGGVPAFAGENVTGDPQYYNSNL
ncbi:MAG: CYTH domain-containing protein [[Clostridium] fimetarium]|nr:CYTH domain-containing protein [Alistipes timonensis]MCM1405044.1 CYTH domain-containing protein [[Clostridium] fimetarium]